MTSRELVRATLEFENHRGRAPRQLWWLPWAQMQHPQALARLQQTFPDDIVYCQTTYAHHAPTAGAPHLVGEYVDEWGCRFLNLQEGVMGEVKQPLVPPQDENWADTSRVHIPTEQLTFSIEQANAFCRQSSRFVLGSCCPRIFEQLQFIRGTEALYMDLFDRNPGLLAFIDKMHGFYCNLLERWAQTEVDGLTIMDDWGSQRALLVAPSLWREVFKPLYRDYVAIAHAAGKKLFMHSDGYILDIIPDLIEIGVDALNAQLFCMGLPRLAPHRGRIAFWGEIDRQHLLPHGSTKDIQAAVAAVHDTLWQNGGCIAQCEFGPGADPENVYQVFSTWNTLTMGGKA